MKNLDVIDLGYGIKLYRNNTVKKFRVLLACLFHGDENCLDVIFHYMRFGYKDISLSFIPIVNQYGYINNIRENEKGENINNSFIHTKTTDESQAILDNIDLIKECSADGFASLHMDKNSTENYTHLWIQREPSEEILKKLNVKDYNVCHNTLEDYLWHEGIPIAACLECNNKKIEFVDKFLGRINEGNVLSKPIS